MQCAYLLYTSCICPPVTRTCIHLSSLSYAQKSQNCQTVIN